MNKRRISGKNITMREIMNHFGTMPLIHGAICEEQPMRAAERIRFSDIPREGEN
jgi:hypothetical protein